MKKLLVLILAFHFSLVFLPQVVMAATAVPVQTTDRSAVITPERVAIVQGIGNRMANRMQAAIDRAKKLVARIQSRVNKLKAQGKDVTKFTNWITTMNTNLDSAQTALSKFRADLANFSTTSDPKTSVQQLQMDAKLVRDALVAVHTTMKQVVQTLLAK